MGSQLMRASIKAFAGSKDDAALKADLAASYADVGSAIDICGADSLNLFAAEIANSEDANLKLFAAKDAAQPTASTNLYQLVGKDGAEVVLTVGQNTEEIYSLSNLSAAWLMLQGQGAVGANADLRSFLWGNFQHGQDGSRIKSAPINIASVATALGASAAQVGSIVDVRGLGNLSLFVHNSDGAVNATIRVYGSWADSQPSALSSMYGQKDASGSLLTYVTLANERAVHPLDGFSADWIGIDGSGNGADVTVAVMGTPSGFSGRY